MNDILSITVDATLEHGTRAKECAANCTKNDSRNKQNLGIHIINEYLIFETFKKTHRYANFN